MTKRDTLLPHTWGTVTADMIAERAAFGQGFFTDSIDLSPAHRQFYRSKLLNTVFAAKRPGLVCKASFAQHGIKIDHNASSPLFAMASHLEKVFSYLGLTIPRFAQEENQHITLTKDLRFRLVHLEFNYGQLAGHSRFDHKVSVLEDDTTEIRVRYLTSDQIVEMLKDYSNDAVFFFQNREFVGYYDSEMEELLPGLLAEMLPGNVKFNAMFGQPVFPTQKSVAQGEAKLREAKLLHVECAQNIISCLVQYGQNETSTPLLEWVYAELKAGRLTAKEIGLGDKTLISDKGRWFVGKEV